MKKFTRLYLTVFILLLSILTACSKPISTTEYLSDVNTDSLIESFDLEKDNLDKYNIYMIGEYHGTVGTFVTKLELIKYFYKTHGVSDLIMETGYSSGFLLNRYINTGVKNFFIKHNVQTDEDGFALSEMLQFIWRSAIRDGKEIWVYIPSIRMRNLLKQWIKQNSPKIFIIHIIKMS